MRDLGEHRDRARPRGGKARSERRRIDSLDERPRSGALRLDLRDEIEAAPVEDERRRCGRVARARDERGFGDPTARGGDALAASRGHPREEVMHER